MDPNLPSDGGLHASFDPQFHLLLDHALQDPLPNAGLGQAPPAHRRDGGAPQGMAQQHHQMYYGLHPMYMEAGAYPGFLAWPHMQQMQAMPPHLVPMTHSQASQPMAGAPGNLVQYQPPPGMGQLITPPVLGNQEPRQESAQRVKGPWSPEEDALLTKLVLAYGDKKWRKWSVIAQHVPGRIGKQCRERWLNNLDQSVKKSPWTQDEDQLLLTYQAQLGNRWCEISKLLPGRPENAVKNRFNSLVARSRSKDAAGNMPPDSDHDEQIPSPSQQQHHSLLQSPNQQPLGAAAPPSMAFSMPLSQAGGGGVGGSGGAFLPVHGGGAPRMWYEQREFVNPNELQQMWNHQGPAGGEILTGLPEASALASEESGAVGHALGLALFPLPSSSPPHADHAHPPQPQQPHFNPSPMPPSLSRPASGRSSPSSADKPGSAPKRQRRETRASAAAAATSSDNDS